jgi:Cys-tRNA(Pro)/Cys-tRNA(Cys) deacylase
MGAMTPAIRALDDAGIDYAIHEYPRDTARRDYGVEAAEALDVDPASVFKTLLVVGDGELAVALIPVTEHLSMKAVGAAIGAKRVAMCDPADAERVTGYVVGGISPLGQRRALPTVVDEWAGALDRIYVSAGRRGLEVSLAPTDLVELLAATYAPLTASPATGG